LVLDEANDAKLMAADRERIMAPPDTIDAEFTKLPPVGEVVRVAHKSEPSEPQ